LTAEEEELEELLAELVALNEALQQIPSARPTVRQELDAPTR
jgi:hypothetical protein